MWAQAMKCLDDETTVMTMSVRQYHSRWYDTQALRALEASRKRGARVQRIAHLKSTLLDDRGAARPHGDDFSDPQMATVQHQDTQATSAAESPDRQLESGSPLDGPEPAPSCSRETVSPEVDRPALGAKMYEDSGGGTSARSDRHVLPRSSAAGQGVPSRQPLQQQWWLRLRSWANFGNRLAYVCCAFFIAAFVLDMSLITLVYPLSLFCYALLVQHQPRAFWQAMLMYTEAVLVAQYAFEVLAHCLCLVHPSGGQGGPTGCYGFLSDASSLQNLELIGLHMIAKRSMPLFGVYLSILIYHYNHWSLETHITAPSGRARSQAAHGVRRYSPPGHVEVTNGSTDRDADAVSSPVSVQEEEDEAEGPRRLLQFYGWMQASEAYLVEKLLTAGYWTVHLGR